ncbi:SpaH/EbpB family LPXTG-anchored major pilin [Bifidobacterium felsineum]|uniref:SpaH/EbpB family LPXTG-anchored major pilin n=1 Tax=Bifidobacterium felsineum TaxID=2045440 RepID=UPI001BDD1B35|nr:SpaH/EbpB family LPXTG-anchored major pilin [Bifidobacterium felsineum]MBT1164333.1 SpaH/EbpB family LPXTG-anchored major pilin [Bifidobacterium felsineum]
MSRSITKCWAAVVAVLAMLVGMLGLQAPHAYAADPVTSASTGSLTMTGLENGVTVKAYKVIDVNWNDAQGEPASPRYTWNSAVQQYIKTNFASYIDSSNNAVTEAYLKADATALATFYDKLSSQTKSLTVAGTETSAGGTAGTDNTASVTFSGLNMGSYLVLVTGGEYVYRASVASIWPNLDEKTNTWKVENGTLTVKRDNVDIDKSVNEENKDHVSGEGVLDKGTDSASIGDTVNFDLRAKVPTFPTNAENKQFYLGDKLSEGLTLDASSIKVYGVPENGAEVLLSGTGADAAYTLTTTGAVRPDNNAAVSFLVNFNYDQIKQYAKVHVDYNATVNEKAVIGPGGNPNTVTLIYSNNPYGNNTYKTHEDKVKVFSYGLDVFKYHKVNGKEEALTGVEFTLKKKGADATLKLIKKADGYYRLPAKGETGTIEALAVGTTSGNEGKLKVDGLDEGTYVLTESKRPAGYGAIAPIEFTIKDKAGSSTVEHTGIEQSSTANDGYHSMKVENVPGLPNTGGVGTVVLTAAGVLLIAGGLLMAIRRKRA